MPDCYGIVVKQAIMLYTDAISSDDGTLEYQWYSTTVNDIATICAIDDETGGTLYTAPKNRRRVLLLYGLECQIRYQKQSCLQPSDLGRIHRSRAYSGKSEILITHYFTLPANFGSEII